MSTSPHYKGSPLLSTQPNEYITRENDKVFTVSPVALDITWGGDDRYWRIEKSKTGTAELVQVSWLQVIGSLEMKHLTPNAKYKLEFEVSLKPDAFGWDKSPVYIMLKLPGQDNSRWKNADLTVMKDNQGSFTIPFSSSSLEFVVPQSSSNDKLIFGLFEIWKGRWKGGLVIKKVKFTKVD